MKLPKLTGNSIANGRFDASMNAEAGASSLDRISPCRRQAVRAHTNIAPMVGPWSVLDVGCGQAGTQSRGAAGAARVGACAAESDRDAKSKRAVEGGGSMLRHRGVHESRRREVRRHRRHGIFRLFRAEYTWPHIARCSGASSRRFQKWGVRVRFERPVCLRARLVRFITEQLNTMIA